MQIIKEKPKIDSVLNARKRAFGQTIEQNDRYTDSLEFTTANFETQDPQMIRILLRENSIPYSIAISPKDTYMPKKRGIKIVQNELTSYCSRTLTENHSKTTSGWTMESCSCLETPEYRI
jgi:hypothetical protein